MNRNLLRLKPKRFLCPYCNGWHSYEQSHELEYYDSESYKTNFTCSGCKGHFSLGSYKVSFSSEKLYYSIDKVCGNANMNASGNVQLSDIKESYEEPRVYFDVPVSIKSQAEKSKCRTCDFASNCVAYQIISKENINSAKITLGFEFSKDEYESITKEACLEYERKKNEASKQSKQQQEELTMANPFNLKMEFGPSNDPNIASTLMGIAVKAGDSWRIYDKETMQLTDIGDMQIGNLPIYILPTISIEPGDLIKDGNEYYYVMNVASNCTQTISAQTGEMRTVIPIQNILGFSCYSKVLALGDSLDMKKDFSMESLVLMSSMCGGQTETDANGQNMQMMLPMILMSKDGLGDQNDIMKMMALSSMCGGQAGNGANDQNMQMMLPMLLMSKDGLGDQNDMMKMMALSSMIGGNANSNNNGMLMFLMMQSMEKSKNSSKTPTAKKAPTDKKAPAKKAPAKKTGSNKPAATDEETTD